MKGQPLAQEKMTRITFESYNDTFYLDCVGHAEYARAGGDILCSAVSMLCYTLDNYLEKVYIRGDVAAYKKDFRDGCVHMEFRIEREKEKIMETVMAFLEGFSLLEESFPDHVSVFY